MSLLKMLPVHAQKKSRFTRIDPWLLGLLFLAMFISVHGAMVFYPHPDEALHISIAKGKSVREVLSYSFYEAHPALGSLLFHVWSLISDSPNFLRGLSLVFWLGQIVLYYRIGKLFQGRLGGISAAMLVTFSYACMEQSYVVRNYSMFLFFLASQCYGYWSWKYKGKLRYLKLYTLSAVFASCFHFSAILPMCCFAAAETALSFRKTEWRKKLEWIVANTVAISAAFAVYLLWRPMLATLQSDTAPIPLAAYLSETMLRCVIYVTSIIGYLSPNIILGTFIGFFSPLLFLYRNSQFRQLLYMCWAGLLLGGILYGTKTYYFSFSRHSLWVTPFVLPVMIWVLTDFLRFCMKIIPVKSEYKASLVIGIIIALMLVSYNPALRFSDRHEYNYTWDSWGTMMQALERLGPRDLVIVERPDAFVIAPANENLYRYFETDHIRYADRPPEWTFRVPLGASAMLVKPAYMHYDGATLQALLRNAMIDHTFDTIDTVYFLQGMSGSVSQVIEHCPGLEKHVIQITDTKENGAKSFLYGVSKKALAEQLLDPSGKAHTCLEYVPKS